MHAHQMHLPFLGRQGTPVCPARFGIGVILTEIVNRFIQGSQGSVLPNPISLAETLESGYRPSTPSTPRPPNSDEMAREQMAMGSNPFNGESTESLARSEIAPHA